MRQQCNQTLNKLLIEGSDKNKDSKQLRFSSIDNLTNDRPEAT
jgi:hypothetical protein